MSIIQDTAVLIRDKDDVSASGVLRTIHYDHADCLKRALMKLGLFWLLALGSIPIIFAHWVLVPGFFIAGPWFAYRTYQVKFAHKDIQGECPACKETIEIKAEARDAFPKWTYCPRCNNPLQVTTD